MVIRKIGMRPASRRTYYYPNDQDAALLWYHDHTMGINRLNMFAGLLGLYIVRDPLEESLNLPRGKYEIRMVLYRPHLRSRRPIELSCLARSGCAVDSGVFRECRVGERQVDALPRGGGAQIPVPGAEWRQRPLLPFVVTRRPGVPPDRNRSRAIARARCRCGSLSLAPGERADVIVDFSGQAGAKIVMSNDVLRPMLQLRVAPAASPDTSSLPRTLRPVRRMAETEAMQDPHAKPG